jgi:hypothetical protein
MAEPRYSTTAFTGQGCSYATHRHPSDATWIPSSSCSFNRFPLVAPLKANPSPPAFEAPQAASPSSLHRLPGPHRRKPTLTPEVGRNGHVLLTQPMTESWTCCRCTYLKLLVYEARRDEGLCCAENTSHTNADRAGHLASTWQQNAEIRQCTSQRGKQRAGRLSGQQPSTHNHNAVQRPSGLQ